METIAIQVKISEELLEVSLKDGLQVCIVGIVDGEEREMARLVVDPITREVAIWRE